VGKKLLPLRVAECSLPPMLAHRAYVDLVRQSEAVAGEMVLAALGRLKGEDFRPQHKPPFPSVSTPPSAARPSRFPGAFPSIWNVPIERNPYFTGRSELLEAMHQRLAQGSTAALTQAIQGLGGVGKTQIALEYAYRHASDYDGVWWLRAEEPATQGKSIILHVGESWQERAASRSCVPERLGRARRSRARLLKSKVRRHTVRQRLRLEREPFVPGLRPDDKGWSAVTWTRRIRSADQPLSSALCPGHHLKGSMSLSGTELTGVAEARD
jgi:hypothetical protein